MMKEFADGTYRLDLICYNSSRRLFLTTLIKKKKSKRKTQISEREQII